MKSTILAIVLLVTMTVSGQTGENDSMVNSALETYIETSIEGFDGISDKRKGELEQIAQYVATRVAKDQSTNLTFICTHNSRRSHLAQIWAQTAAVWYGVPHVETYSGGTEATAFNPRAVRALEDAGFAIERTSDAENPRYRVMYSESSPPLVAFSKVYNEPPNPAENFCAVMTCSDADEACPVVFGAAGRVAIPYEDPKEFDGTDQEAAAYAERCRQISTEMLYAFSRVNVTQEQ
ncbi:protein-tyrosine-phosphatase [candidate division GN15 bacterium]|nr:protein-tyrosine-phosphatase [candidate division GN15 bacterium]